MSASGCSTGGTALGTVSLIQGLANATGTSPSFVPDARGTWCFRAEYSGDSNYAPSSDGSSAECFSVGEATASVVSTPTNQTTTLAVGDSDQVTVTGNAVGGSPAGTVSFFICGPLTSAAGCAGGGTAVGMAVPLTATAGDTATATSDTFPATSAGIWCFRAEYSGDGNYNPGSDGSAGECFTVLQPGAPTATIASPNRNAIYGVGQVVDFDYSCAEAPGGPGLSSCTGTVPSGAPIDTSTRGRQTVSVTAGSTDGLTTTVFASYTVTGPPSVSILSPTDGASYTLGEVIGVGYRCAEDPFGPGLASCSAPATFVYTNATGTFPLTVSASSLDGQTTAQTIHYNVIVPPNRFTVSHLRPHRGGRVRFQLTIPGGGTVNIRETAPRSALPQPKPGRFLFAHLRLQPSSAATLLTDVLPNRRGNYLLHHHRFAVRVRLTVTYTPTNGTARSSTFRGLRVTR